MKYFKMLWVQYVLEWHMKRVTKLLDIHKELQTEFELNLK